MEHIADDDLEGQCMRSLSPQDAERLGEHLLLCADCRDRLQVTDEYVRAMREAADRIGRSYEKIEDADLARLAQLASEDREGFFARKPQWRELYAGRVVAVALCQGAALHFVDGQSGVKDFDVWTFFAEQPGKPFPYRRSGTQDFGPSKFGRWECDGPQFVGRRVDLLARSLLCSVDADPIEALRRYLSQPTTKSTAELAQKAVVLLEPISLRGRIVWPASLPSVSIEPTSKVP